MERKRPLLEKQNSSKKNTEETSRRTRSSRGNAYKRINYCEDSSSDESADDCMLRTHLPSQATGGDNSLKEAPSSQTTLLNKNKTDIFYKKIDKSKDISSDDLNIDVAKSGTKDFIPNADEFLQASSNSPILPDTPDLPESRSSSPFQFWGQNYDAKRCSKGDKEDKVDTEDGTIARKASNLLNKDNVNKEWEKRKALLLNKDKKIASKSKADNADAVPGKSSSFDHARKCSEDDR